jgi:hypothetical protein
MWPRYTAAIITGAIIMTMKSTSNNPDQSNQKEAPGKNKQSGTHEQQTKSSQHGRKNSSGNVQRNSLDHERDRP